MQTNTVMMVPPVSFGFNDETGLDNEFQHRPDVDEEVIEGKALGEFDDAAASLRVAGVNVLELEPSGDGLETPDAIFPNNWFVTDGDGRIWIYTMKTENRRWEIRPEDAADLLGRKGYKVTAIEKVSEDPEQILEGTGAIVFDHEHRLAYAALSERCQESLLRSHCERIGYRPVAFTTQSSKGQPIYHTNVVMSVGKDFVVACVESIVEADRQGFLDALEASGKKLMDISFAQMEQHFCGNILELATEDGKRLLALSAQAWNGFDEQQQAFFNERMEICAPDITTIETVGGGSMRCMLAEVFNPPL